MTIPKVIADNAADIAHAGAVVTHKKHPAAAGLVENPQLRLDDRGYLSKLLGMYEPDRWQGAWFRQAALDDPSVEPFVGQSSHSSARIVRSDCSRLAGLCRRPHLHTRSIYLELY
jgi:hypothetical protein